MPKNVPQADVGRRGFVIGPGAAAAVGHGHEFPMRAARRRPRRTLPRTAARPRPALKPPELFIPDVAFRAGRSIKHVLSDQRGLGPFQPARRAFAIADRVVALDAAVR